MVLVAVVVVIEVVLVYVIEGIALLPLTIAIDLQSNCSKRNEIHAASCTVVTSCGNIWQVLPLYEKKLQKLSAEHTWAQSSIEIPLCFASLRSLAV